MHLMKKVVGLIFAAALTVSVMPLRASPSFTPIRVGFFGSPACPYGTHYVCSGPTVQRICGCVWGGDRPACPAGYHWACYEINPGAGPYCACY